MIYHHHRTGALVSLNTAFLHVCVVSIRTGVMNKLPAILLGFTFAFVTTGPAQTETITLTATNGQATSFNCSTNQIITVNSFIGNSQGGGTPFGPGSATFSYTNGHKTTIWANAYGLIINGSPSAVFNGSAMFTGVTNILVSADSDVVALTFTVTTPTAQSSIPANTIVIPTDATGPVLVVLESSADLVNWTSALPGIYGNTYSNRFFRVRAIAQ